MHLIRMIAAVSVIIGFLWAPVHAALYDFAIEGTITDGLTTPDGTTTILQTGGLFTFTGTFDSDLEPVVETNSNGTFPIPDAFGSDFGTITPYTFTGIDLGAITTYYPSDSDALNSNDKKNAAYSLYYSSPVIQQTFEIYDDFTHFYFKALEIGSGVPTIYEAYIEYNYYLEITGSGEITTEIPRHDTINLQVTGYTITEQAVPLPGSIILLASAMAALSAFQRNPRRFAGPNPSGKG